MSASEGVSPDRSYPPIRQSGEEEKKSTTPRALSPRSELLLSVQDLRRECEDFSKKLIELEQRTEVLREQVQIVGERVDRAGERIFRLQKRTEEVHRDLLNSRQRINDLLRQTAETKSPPE